MDNREAVNWLTNVLADIGKAEHSDLWHYEQALTEIKDMLESAQPVLTCKGCKYDYYEMRDAATVLEGRGICMSQNDDLISRQEVVDAYGDWYVVEGTAEGFIGTVKQLLEGLPPAQRNGTWITDSNDNDNAYCSECGLITTKDLLKRIALVGENKPKFCPNCGAKMEDNGW